MVRKAGELVEVSWPEALDAAAAGLRARSTGGPSSIAVLGGARGTNEDAYAWARSPRVCSAPTTSTPSSPTACPPRWCSACRVRPSPTSTAPRAIVLVGPDLKDELPVLYLRVRRAAVDLGVPVIEIAPRASGLTRYASAVLRHAPGDAGTIARQFARAVAGDGTASGDGQVERATAALDGREGDIVVILGRQSVAESADAVVQAAAALAGLPDTRFLSALRRGNVHGALDLGLTPGFLPAGSRSTPGAMTSPPRGARCLRGSRSRHRRRPRRRGRRRDRHARAPRRRPDRRLPRPRARARRARQGELRRGGRRVHRRRRRTPTCSSPRRCGEKAGSTTNLEGRVMRLARLVSPDGTTMPDWRIAAELALRFGADFGFETVEDVQDEIARVARARGGRRRAPAARARRRGAADQRVPRRDRAGSRGKPLPTGVSWGRHRTRLVVASGERSTGETRRRAKRDRTTPVD